MDPYDILQGSLNSDGTLNRSNLLTLLPIIDEPFSLASAGVSVENFPLDPSHGTRLWIFTPPGTSLPILLYVHGGGFILFSSDTGSFVSTCRRLSGEIPAVIVAVEHRLAPEHRLPAAYDDVLDALRWLHRQSVDVSSAIWRRDQVDFSRLFFAGSSSGGNIVFHVAQKLITEDLLDLREMEIKGIFLNEPFFGGNDRTPSEAASKHDKALPLAVSDLLWEMALPEGADRDHFFCNPFLRRPREGKLLLPRCLIRCYVGDPLVDRLKAMAEILEKEAVSVEVKMEEDGFHGADFFDSSKFNCFVADVKNFIASS